MTSIENNQTKAKSYQRVKNIVLLIHYVLLLVLFLIILLPPKSLIVIPESLRSLSPYIQLAAFFGLFSFYFFLGRLPLSIYSGYILEKQFELSRQTFWGWFLRSLKAEMISFVFMGVLVILLYALIWHAGDLWWFYAWISYALVSLGMGKLFPVLIVPLFYRYTPLPEGSLKTRIKELTERFQLKIKDVYSLNLSQTTKKANAMFCGIGKTKRIVMSDTLLENFTDDEIMAVLAHELGHYCHRDIWRQFWFGFSMSFLTFYISFLWLKTWVPEFGIHATSDIKSFPILCFIMFMLSFVLTPVGNLFSRWLERAADRFAIDTLKESAPFIDSMKKLAQINLADMDPNPVIEFLFHSHPSIRKRIQWAEQLQ
ncbi:MAG: hypothetical protein COV74_05375 [Candidatus Omnitrophica bacterium CG11_big_fil_rev_8_21_14_0_20_45_26]|uniref:Peptidase n=1 Tax=Candidatus Abzuiibacterium crystallinum TaxID=1974748 RepID=A0A2H0LPM2_9BACT|nr:MAG: hypothetical protein COV74_05375 [Candidatus Omnitrophica bacterium CG11_big_fil_rev_8_21_14_0_20_45_26]PIW64321.1 MAG: hypothetical protein COW12_06695 [Candidatus Omnitrophica bacterium CG12_big_fil_rev_8_21_14_0_65_45_16]